MCVRSTNSSGCVGSGQYRRFIKQHVRRPVRPRYQAFITSTELSPSRAFHHSQASMNESLVCALEHVFIWVNTIHRPFLRNFLCQHTHRAYLYRNNSKLCFREGIIWMPVLTPCCRFCVVAGRIAIGSGDMQLQFSFASHVTLFYVVFIQ